MQLFLLVLMLGIFAHDLIAERAVMPAWLELQGWPALALLVLPKLLLALALGLLARRTLRRLARGTVEALRQMDRFTASYRSLVLGLFALDLATGLLNNIRAVLDTILLDELLAMSPSLLLLGWSWWLYYPIDRRLREAALIRQLDQGQPVQPVLTRAQYLLANFRHQAGLMFVPLLVLRAWSEAVNLFAPEHLAAWDLDPRPLLLVAGAGCLFLVAPVMIRHLWDTMPLPDGELRERLGGLCRHHGVRVRELLLWRTFGGMINAAVMGIVAPLRYILLTDALLERLPVQQVEAVMAHEIAHVRRRHMFWLLVVAVGAMGALEAAWAAAVQPVLGYLAEVSVHLPERLGRAARVLSEPDIAAVAVMGAALTSWVFVFGWVSRRFERQADAFAVQHLAEQHAFPGARAGVPGADGLPGGGVVIDIRAVEVMTAALQQVADLNQIPAQRPSWRHGSIAWRQNYLRSLIGTTVGKVPIDRHMCWIHAAALLALAVRLGVQLPLIDWSAPVIMTAMAFFGR